MRLFSKVHPSHEKAELSSCESSPMNMNLRRLGLIAQSLLYLASGVHHFRNTAMYRPAMPDHYANPDAMIRASGAAEIMIGAGLLVPNTTVQSKSAFGAAAMLVVFLDVHQFMARHPERFPQIPRWALWARLPLQGLLIAWAWNYARNPESLFPATKNG
jgi:uncharacterized membrane protein